MNAVQKGKIKTDNLDIVVNSIFSAERERLEKILLGLLLENTTLTNKPLDGFIYAGSMILPYDRKSYPNNYKLELGFIDKTLVTKLQDVIKEHKKLNDEMIRVKQALSIVMGSASNFEDIRNSLPDCIVNQLTVLNGIPRTKPEPKLPEGVMNIIRYHTSIGIFMQ